MPITITLTYALAAAVAVALILLAVLALLLLHRQTEKAIAEMEAERRKHKAADIPIESTPAVQPGRVYALPRDGFVRRRTAPWRGRREADPLSLHGIQLMAQSGALAAVTADAVARGQAGKGNPDVEPDLTLPISGGARHIMAQGEVISAVNAYVAEEKERHAECNAVAAQEPDASSCQPAVDAPVDFGSGI